MKIHRTSSSSHPNTLERLSTDEPKKNKVHDDQGSLEPPMIPASSKLNFSRSIAIIAVCVASFAISTMPQLAVNVMTPVIQRELSINSSDLQWLVGGYSLGYGSTLLLTGRLSDLYGHKLFLQIGLILFGTCSLACSLSHNFIQLATFRALQGLASAAMAPSLLGILGRTFEMGDKLRTVAFSAFAAGAPLGAAIGLIAGGFITQGTKTTWRSFFYLALALSSVVCISAYFVLPPDERRSGDEPKETIDWLGAALIISGLAMLIASLATSSRAGWTSPSVLAPFIISLFLLACFVAWEYTLERRKWGDPLMRLSMFKRPCFAAVQVITGLLCFQDYLHLPLTQVVLRLLPMLVVGVIITWGMSHVANVWSGQILMLIGCTGTTISCLLMALTNPTMSYWTYNFFAIALSVVGADVVFTTGTMYGSKVSAKHEQAVAGGIFHTFAQIITAIGLSIATIVQVKVTQSESKSLGSRIGIDLTAAPREAYLSGLRGAFWACFCSVSLATALCFLCLRGMGFVGTRGENSLNDTQLGDPSQKLAPKEDI